MQLSTSPNFVFLRLASVCSLCHYRLWLSALFSLLCYYLYALFCLRPLLGPILILLPVRSSSPGSVRAGSILPDLLHNGSQWTFVSLIPPVAPDALPYTDSLISHPALLSPSSSPCCWSVSLCGSAQSMLAYKLSSPSPPSEAILSLVASLVPSTLLTLPLPTLLSFVLVSPLLTMSPPFRDKIVACLRFPHRHPVV